MDANHKMQLTRGQGEIEKLHYWSMRRMQAMEEYVHRLAADFMAVSTRHRFIKWDDKGEWEELLGVLDKIEIKL